ncbi:MAG: hypothetical protein DRN81_03340 [Thermoproteota archaeon]|nr:MAG: hypothetical protein DRN81_03340 [Candidatus Korarchaeota archaeon]
MGFKDFFPYLGKGKGPKFWHTPIRRTEVKGPEELGYYVDFSSKTSWSHLDERGIPLLYYGSDIGWRYNPTAVAQFGLGSLERYRRGEGEAYFEMAKAQGRWLLRQMRERDGVGVWEYDFDIPAYGIKAPWVSALAQGQGISLLVRLYLVENDVSFLETASKAIESFKRSVEEGGVSRKVAEGIIYEEVPSERPSCILDGFIFSLFGLYDYWRVTGREEALWREGIRTLKALLPLYDLGFWSRGDLFREKPKMIASSFYHRLHIYQLEALYDITGEEGFRVYASRWKAYERNSLFRIAAFLYKLYFKALYY